MPGPTQTVEEWEKELNVAVSYAVDHLSLYQLTIEEGTAFYGLHKAGKLIVRMKINPLRFTRRRNRSRRFRNASL